jgi:hypothetical protein
VAKPDFLKYLTPKAIINLSIVLGFLIFVIPTLLFLGNEVEQRATFIRAQRVKIDAHARIIAELAELRKASTEAEQAMLKLQTIIPTRDRLFSFPKHVEELGSNNNLVASINFTGRETPAIADKAGDNAFKITSGGSFNNTLEFIENIEASWDFFVSLESIDMVVGTGEQFNSTINGAVFFYD